MCFLSNLLKSPLKTAQETAKNSILTNILKSAGLPAEPPSDWDGDATSWIYRQLTYIPKIIESLIESKKAIRDCTIDNLAERLKLEKRCTENLRDKYWNEHCEKMKLHDEFEVYKKTHRRYGSRSHGEELLKEVLEENRKLKAKLKSLEDT
jgi:hypothetical protein